MEINKIKKPDMALIAMLVCMATCYVLIHDLLGGTLFSHSHWDSYTLQAEAWLSGSLSLRENYSYLELAVYNGQYFVSFPPLPSVFILPLVLIFGENTPNNLLIAVYAMATAVIAYKLLTRLRTERTAAAFASVFYVFGSNMMWMSTNGGVWFQAQSLNLLLLTAMVYAAVFGKRIAAYALAALAVGCRPFSAVAFVPLFAAFYIEDRARTGRGGLRTALCQWPCLIIPVLVAAAYMWYNCARFDNVFEFGHNYLPEFMESEKGQFDLSYIPGNLGNLFFRPVSVGARGELSYSYFDGFMFYIANPLYIVLFIRAAADAVKKRMSALGLVLLCSVFVELVLLCAHKTLGGWQFGARYTVDMLPFALWYICTSGSWELRGYERLTGILAIMFNIYGALAMTFLYS